MKKLIDLFRQGKPEAEAASTNGEGFTALKLLEPLVQALLHEGYTDPTPIQQQAIPHVLEGRDLLGIAQTGTGKTAAFALPILQRLILNPPGSMRQIRALILAPTRELAIQIDESFANYGAKTSMRRAVIFGGVGQNSQVQALKRHPEIVVATPGRLLDLMQQGFVSLTGLEILVLDEADRMLDMGFIHDIKKVIAVLPKQRQNLLFSATMPNEIMDLVRRILNNPVKVEVAPVSTTAETIDQSLYMVAKGRKIKLLAHLLDTTPTMTRILVFTRTKHGANRVAESLTKSGHNAAAIHGNKSQSARQRALQGFKDGTVKVLVASDLASRGIDVEEISHVVNFDLPNVPETYVHRIGRTGRAKAIGTAIAFCDQSEERDLLRDIERLIRRQIPTKIAEGFDMTAPIEKEEPRARGPRPQHRGGGRSQGQRSQGQGQGSGQGQASRPGSSQRRRRSGGGSGSGGGGGGGSGSGGGGPR